MRRLSADTPLYHYAPHKERLTILNEGLKVGREGYISCGTTPREAFNSAGLPEGRYDLWQITRDDGDQLKNRKDNGYEILEVKIFNDISMLRVWLAGSAYRGNMKARRY